MGNSKRKSKMTVPVSVRRGLLAMMEMGLIMDSRSGYSTVKEGNNVDSAMQWLEKLTDQQKQEDEEKKEKYGNNKNKR